MRRRLVLWMVTGLVTVSVQPVTAAVPNLINFQGILTDGSGVPQVGGPFSVTFSVYDDASAANPALWSEPRSVTTDAQGRFTVLLGSVTPITDAVFSDADRWLGVTVSPDVTDLLPRTRISSVAYAFRPATVDGASGGNITSKVAIGSGHTNTGIEAFVAGEGNEASGDYSAVGGGLSNSANGTFATVGGGFGDTASSGATVGGGIGNNAFIQGTIAGGSYNSTSAIGATIGGGISNSIWISGCIPCESHSTIGGGASNQVAGAYSFIGAGLENIVAGDSSVIGGGAHNEVIADGAVVGGGANNRADRDGAVVGGGSENYANSEGSAILGGRENHSGGAYGVVGGGGFNYANGEYSSILGGQQNYTTGNYSCVLFGTQSQALGDYSFAAGNHAVSNHSGAVVWADNSAVTDFGSTGINQFLIRADGGVGIGTNKPGKPLQVGDDSTAGAEGMIRLESRSSTGSNDLRDWEIGVPQTGNDATGKGYNFVIDDTHLGTDPEVVVDWGTGNMGLGVLDPSNRITLPNNANTTGQGKANAWVTYSSRRWKENIKTIGEALEKVGRLRGVEYDNKSDGTHSIGLIAEEVGKVIPEVVQYESNGTDAASLDYARLVALLVEAVKEQQKRIESLENRIENSTP